MNENYMEESRKSGTALKVTLIIITVIAVVAAVAMGLLFYNAKSNLDLFRERNNALSEERKKDQTKITQYEEQIDEYEAKITELTQQLQDAQEQLDLMKPEINDPDNEGGEGTSSNQIIDLSGNTDLAVKPTSFYDKGVEYTVAVAGLNVRSGPGTTYKPLASINLNSSITAYAEDGDWLLVSYKDNAYGWVKNSFVTKE